ncbi:MAG: cell wall-associated protein precursor wapA [Pseudobdellovibrio sp.]|nr:cell wall-associated protein precursor wapA [Pseudobdellovibrio sp.]
MTNNVLLSLLLFLSVSTSHALVDMNSASYSNVWTDMHVQGPGYDLKIVRAYRSRTLFNGMFGFGWCSSFETRLETTSEGNIKISECGDGQEVVYSPREIQKRDVENTITQIISKMKADPKQKSLSADYYKKLQADLFEDDNRRSSLAREYKITIPIKEGTKFLANGQEVENVVFSKGAYIRNLADGTNQRFDLQGRMTHSYDKNANFLKFEYDKDLLVNIEDNNNRKLFFKYYPNRKVKQVTGPNGLISEYKYNSQEDLIWNKNAWARNDKEVYTYEYNEFHNLTKAVWPDKNFISLKYDNLKDWVISFTDREKCVENYKYEFSESDPRFHYWSTVTKTCDKKVVTKNRYEFWHKLLPSGEVVLSRVLTNINGSTTDITYHPIFGKAISIKKNNNVINFDYYPDGLVKTKEGANSKYEYIHDPSTKKLSVVKNTVSDDKGKVVSVVTNSFKYDPKGNLTYAENSDGQKITMTYDLKGRIATITDQAKKIVKIEYEERHGKPAIVSRPGVGVLKITYKSNGDIAKVDSPDGPTVASQVASTFSNLLDIISPATQDAFKL